MRVKRWARLDSSRQSKKQEGEKKAGISVNPTGGFQWHIMCLVSYGSKSKLTSSLLLSVSLSVGSACFLLSVENTESPLQQKGFISVPYKEELHVGRQIVLMNWKILVNSTHVESTHMLLTTCC